MPVRFNSGKVCRSKLLLELMQVSCTNKDCPTNSPHSAQLWPRVIRASDAPRYLGLDKNKFNKIVRPYITAVPLGPHSVGYDRLDLDRWWEEYKSRHGRPGAEQIGGNQQWDEELPRVSRPAKVSGTSTRSSKVSEFAKALERVTRKKQKQSSRNV